MITQKFNHIMEKLKKDEEFLWQKSEDPTTW